MRPLYSFLFFHCLVFCVFAQLPLETGTRGESGILTKKIDNFEKTKRQNENGGGEEVDLSVIPEDGQSQQPNVPRQPGQQPPFFGNGNPFFPQQPFGYGFPGGFQNYPGGFPQQGFPQGFPQAGGFPQIPGRNIILQNNGKQYLVQPLNENQRVVEKNGKQYLLQPYPANANSPLTGLQTFNVPDNILNGLQLPIPQRAGLRNGVNGLGVNPAFSGVNPGLSAGNPNYAQIPGFSFSPAVAAVQPNALASNERSTSLPVQQRQALDNGRTVQFQQIPFREGGSSPFLSTAVGAVAAQLAASGQQYAPYQYAGGPLGGAYARAAEAGYGFYPNARTDGLDPNEPRKRSIKGKGEILATE